MTEYTTSPEAYEEYMSARERTAYWVQAHSSDPDGFYSPSIPPTILEGFVPPSPPSDAGSSHSLPPKMVLRYGDGRPDIPIPHVNAPMSSRRYAHGDVRGPQYGPSHHQRSHTTPSTHNAHPSSAVPVRPSQHSNHSSQQGRSGSQIHSRSRHPDPLGASANSPEEIRVLPSNAPPNPVPLHVPSHHERSHHSRSRSLPRTVIDPHFTAEETFDSVPISSSQSRPIAYPPPPSHLTHGTPQANFANQAGPGPWHGAYTSSSSTKHSHGHPSHKVPPAIVYAPSHHGRAPHYAPPAILYHQPQRGPNGMIYSHSAPVPIQGGAYPAPMTTDDFAERGRRDRTRSLEPGVVHKVQRSDDGEVSGAESAGSGSTYYVLPSAGQKVHVIAPSPGESVHTATSTTKSPGPSPRKPFFQRLLSFAKIGSSTGGSTRGPRRKLQRRHSTGNSGRPAPVPVNPTPEPGVPN